MNVVVKPTKEHISSTKEDGEDVTWIQPGDELEHIRVLKESGAKTQKARRNEKVHNELDNLFCGRCYSLERKKNIKLDDKRYHTLKLVSAVVRRESHPLRGEHIAGINLEYKCLERGICTLLKMISVIDARRMNKKLLGDSKAEKMFRESFEEMETLIQLRGE